MAPSLRKQSLGSAADSIPLDAPPQYQHAQPAQPTSTTTTTSNSTRPCAANQTVLYYPRSAPGRTAFLTARSLVVLLSTVLFVLAFPAERVAHRGRWMSAVLSPAINAWIANAMDIYAVVRWAKRSHPLQRLLWDGTLSAGFAISGGFMASMTRGDITRTAQDGTLLSAVLGVVMVLCLFAVCVLELGIAVGGGKQYMALRQARRAPQVAV